MKPHPAERPSQETFEEQLHKKDLHPAEEQQQSSQDDRIDEAMAESFPASDPPSWTSGVKQKEDDLQERARE